MLLTAADVYKKADCEDHPLPFNKAVLEGAETLFARGGCGCYPNSKTYETCGTYCDSESFALAKLTNGLYLVIRESSDSSGHGCQCSGSASIHPTLDEAIRLGFTDDERSVYLIK